MSFLQLVGSRNCRIEVNYNLCTVTRFSLPYTNARKCFGEIFKNECQEKNSKKEKALVNDLLMNYSNLQKAKGILCGDKDNIISPQCYGK